MRRAAAIAGALACLAGAAFLFLVAADVSRWRDALAAGDVRYRAAPRDESLWRPAEIVPLGVAERTLGVGDDLAFRDALRSLRLGRLEDAVVSDPELALRRSEAQARLQALAEGDDDAARRSRAAGLLGVVSFAAAVNAVRDREALLEETILSFRRAIELDPGNAEAKANLEVALQRGRGLQAAESSGTPNPSPGALGSRGAGAGDAGSGY